jgi:outer membrane protein TolC
LQPPPGETATHALPDFALGLPSDVARRRPDIRAAEARLQQATANIGVATADLYPSIRLGARFGFESVQSDRVLEWGSRAWSLGPLLSLPIFDQGRRRSTVRLRTAEQQEAALAFQKTVLQAWQEIDDALTAYNAERQALAELRARARTAADAVQLAQARYRGGLIDSQPLTEAMRTRLQAARQVATSEQRLNTRFAMIAKAIAAGYASGPGQQRAGG